jgi:hypothetical protein
MVGPRSSTWMNDVMGRPRASVGRVESDHAHGGGVRVDDQALLVHHDPVGRVLDEQLQALADIGRDPGDVAGLRHVGGDPEEVSHLAVGDDHGPHENAVDLTVGGLVFLDELIVLPHHARRDRLQDGGEQGVTELVGLDHPPGRTGRDMERSRGGILEQPREGGVPAQARAWDLELPGHDAGQVREGREPSGPVGHRPVVPREADLGRSGAIDRHSAVPPDSPGASSRAEVSGPDADPSRGWAMGLLSTPRSSIFTGVPTSGARASALRHPQRLSGAAERPVGDVVLSERARPGTPPALSGPLWAAPYVV